MYSILLTLWRAFTRSWSMLRSELEFAKGSQVLEDARRDKGDKVTGIGKRPVWNITKERR